MDFVWGKPTTFKEIILGGVQKSVGRLLVLLAEIRSYSTSGICSLLFLVENQCRAMVQLLRNPAFLIAVGRGGGGGRGPPPIKQMLGLGITVLGSLGSPVFVGLTIGGQIDLREVIENVEQILNSPNALTPFKTCKSCKSQRL